MKIVSANSLKKAMQLVKNALAGKEPAFSKNSGFNLTRTDNSEDSSMKLLTAKGGLIIKNELDDKKLNKGSYTGTASDLDYNIGQRVPYKESRPFSGLHFSSNDSLHWHSNEFGYLKFWDTGNFDPNTKTEKGGYSGSAKDLENGIVSAQNTANLKLNKAGDTMTGLLTANGGVTIGTETEINFNRNTDWLKLGFKNTGDADADSYGYFDIGDNGNEYFKFISNAAGTKTETLSIKTDNVRFKGNQIYHEGFKPSPAAIGAVKTTTNSNIGTDNSESCVAYVSNSLMGASDGALYSHVYSNLWKHQIQGDYRTGNIAVRGKNNGNWQPWYRIYSENFKPTASDIKALPNPGYGGVHELGRYLDLHLSGSGADYDARIYTDGGQTVKTSGNLNVAGKTIVDCARFSSGLGQTPNISFAVGDSDTGINWNGDGNISMWANNVAVCNYTSGQIVNHKPLLNQQGCKANAGGSDWWSQITSRTHGFTCEDVTLPNSSSHFVKLASLGTVASNYGYWNRSAIGILRSANDQGGQFVIASHGDSSGHPLKTWSFKYSNGDFSSPGNVIAYSDAKLKKDLEIIPDALEKIDALNGYTYTRIDTGEKQTGVVAQEVQAVLPEAVTKTKTADDEEILGVAYGNMAGLFIEAIKELKKEIKSLKLEVEKLKFKEEK